MNTDNRTGPDASLSVTFAIGGLIVGFDMAADLYDPSASRETFWSLLKILGVITAVAVGAAAFVRGRRAGLDGAVAWALGSLMFPVILLGAHLVIAGGNMWFANLRPPARYLLWMLFGGFIMGVAGVAVAMLSTTIRFIRR